MIEEAFIDVFCDLIWGGGWMDVERSEEVDRECNWALVRHRTFRRFAEFLQSFKG